MKVSTRNLDGVPVVDVKGDVDMHTSPALLQALSRLTEDSRRLIVVNLAEVDFMDSSGVATLVQALKEVRPHGGQIRLAAPGGNVTRVFKLSNLTSLFPSYATVEEAVTARRNAEDA